MSYKYSFADNAEYGAEDLNSLVSSLVSKGVADPFVDGEAYNASKLNDVVSLIYTEGVVPEDVNTLRVTKVSDGVIAIAPGLAFFADGSTLRVTETETLPYTEKEINYVYLKQDLVMQNRNYPACTTKAPTGDFVLLAEIAADGTITDKRMYAKGKVPGYQSNADACMTMEKNIYVDMGNERTGTFDFSIDLGGNNYSRVFLVERAHEKTAGIGIYDLTDGSHLYVYYNGYSNGGRMYTDKIMLTAAGDGARTASAYLVFTRNGNVLNGVLKWSNPDNYNGAWFKLSLSFC